ncbi:MAG TPA: hypothetical protein VM925_34390 [Labilithrix sp.]|nr:hypothetical protein [Labilithrix sp.]
MFSATRASALGSLVSVALLTGCAGSDSGKTDVDATPPAASTPGANDGGGSALGDFGQSDATAPPPENVVKEVFGHSASTLYKLDPKTKAVTEVGPFEGCGAVIDIAIDEASNLYADASNALYTVDKTTAVCTKISGGSGLPDSLSFVPKGTLDPNEEALVGYTNSDYVRIDVKTGVKTVIGPLEAGGLISSGDVVSVKGGPTFLTAKVKIVCTNPECKKCSSGDCLLEVDPKTGKMLKNWGSVGHNDVFGLSFWGGKLYGFDNAGNLFEVAFGPTEITVTDIPIPSKPKDLSFWGAASSTSAPLVAPGPS